MLNFLNKNKIRIFPNPSSEELTISLDDKSKLVQVKILDMQGKKVFEKVNQENNVTINTSSFAKGNFIVSIETEKDKFLKKIIIE